MGENSKIEWCHHTFNPWIGCTKVSPGCANCYAEKSTRARVLRSEGHETWGKGAKRSLTSEANWKQPLKWNERTARTRVGIPGNHLVKIGTMDGKVMFTDVTCPSGGVMPPADWEALPKFRPRVFCASLSDWLDDEVPIEWLGRLLKLIRDTPHLDWLLLTKRPQNWQARLHKVSEHLKNQQQPHAVVDAWLDGHAPANVWIGTTMEDQTRADERIPVLLNIPATVRFLSCEPLLSIVDLHSAHIAVETWRVGESFNGPPPLNGIHWVICGGESGPNARPMHPDWARSLRDQCHAAGVPFFFKQWGDWVYPAYADPSASFDDFPKAERGQVWQPTSTSRHGYDLLKLGKKKAGRLLDGIEHNGFPL